MENDLEKFGKLPITLKLVRQEKIKEEIIIGKVAFIKDYNGLSECRAYHFPISKIIDYTLLNNEE